VVNKVDRLAVQPVSFAEKKASSTCLGKSDRIANLEYELSSRYPIYYGFFARAMNLDLQVHTSLKRKLVVKEELRTCQVQCQAYLAPDWAYSRDISLGMRWPGNT